MFRFFLLNHLQKARCHTLTCIEDLIDVNVYHVMAVSFKKLIGHLVFNIIIKTIIYHAFSLLIKFISEFDERNLCLSY
jgi:hypothetical protein